MKSLKKQIVLAKVEATYGMPETLAAANAIVMEDVKFTPQAEVLTRAPLGMSMTPGDVRVGGVLSKLSGSAELKGGGIDGTNQPLEPDWGPLLRGCAMHGANMAALIMASADGYDPGDRVHGQTSATDGVVRFVNRATKHVIVEITAGTAFQAAEQLQFQAGWTGTPSAITTVAKGFGYRPLSDPEAMKSCTIAFWMDGIKHLLKGARGTFSLDLKAKAFGKIGFEFTGLWSDPADDAALTGAYSSVVPPVVESMNLRLGDYAADVGALSLTFGNKITPRTSLNSPEGVAGIVITDRDPKGSMDPEVFPLSTYNPWTSWRASAGAPLIASLGAAQGFRVGIGCAKLMRESVEYSSRDDMATYAEKYRLGGTADDELAICLY